MDAYLYPGTLVLKNLLDIRDAEILSGFEAETTAWRIRQLEHRPIPGAFDSTHLRAIHRHVFQDLFDWAGEFRTVDISRGDQMFAVNHFIALSVDKLALQLVGENYCRGLAGAQLAERAAYYLNEINAIHPFREGNGRTQREFIRALALAAGFPINWARIARDDMYEASRLGFIGGGTDAMRDVVSRAMGLR